MQQPSRESVLHHPRLHVSRHPVVADKLGALRDKQTDAAAFSRLVQDLSILLAYEVLDGLSTEEVQVATPLEVARGSQVAERAAFVPILRAGAGMLAGFRRMLPLAPVWYLGLRRDEETLQPVAYYDLPAQVHADLCVVLDPMLATGGSALAAVTALKERGATGVAYAGLIAAPFGVQRLLDRWPDVEVHVAALDRELNERGYILPGLGDAGDRQFGTD